MYLYVLIYIYIYTYVCICMYTCIQWYSGNRNILIQTVALGFGCKSRYVNEQNLSTPFFG